MSDTDINLHLGCGKRVLPGFVHIDLADYPHIAHRRDIRDLSFLPDGYAALIYSCHSFEYFDRHEAVAVLREWNRVLRLGGVLRLAVPDFEALLEVYRRSDDLSRVLGPLFGRWEINPGQLIYHRTVYDFNSLSTLLTANGFGQVRRYDWRQTIHRDFDDHSQAYFPHMDKENGLLISLNVEAIKR
jgi:predicted SAM-dependent methyltransferase